MARGIRPATIVRPSVKPSRVFNQEQSLSHEEAPEGYFFKSDIVQDELRRLETEGSATAHLLELFPAMSIAGKRNTLDDLEAVSSRFEVFYTRLRLSADPHAKAYMTRMQATMMDHGSSWDGFFQTKRKFFAVLRALVDLEEQHLATANLQAAELVRDAQDAWLAGKYQEWAQAFTSEESP